jgi:prolyl 4-hydroxylase
MHHKSVSTNFAWLPHNVDRSLKTPSKYSGVPINPLGDRQSFYDEFVDACRKEYGFLKGFLCLSNEDDRINTALLQPQSMQNYTDIGYKKIKAPKELFSAISAFWERNKDKGKEEVWGVGNTYTNNWESPTEMVSIEDYTLRGGGDTLKNTIWNIAKDVSSTIAVLLFLWNSFRFLIEMRE